MSPSILRPWSTGKLFEDVRDAVHQLADPERYDALVIINLCVPSASGVPLRLLPDAINGVRVIGIDVPGFGVPTHAEAKDVLSAAMLRRARLEAEQGPVQAPRGGRSERPAVALIGELFPADPVGLGMLLGSLDLAAGPWSRPANGGSSMAPWTAWPGPPSTPITAVSAVSSPPQVGRCSARPPSVTRARPPGWRPWAPCSGSRGPRSRPPSNTGSPPSKGRSPRHPSGGASASRATRARLLVGRLLVESGADLRYVGTACGRTEWSALDRDWLESHGVRVQYRATLEQDLAAMDEFQPDLVVGTTPVVQKAKEAGTPALYFTNLISARPLMGVAGAGSLAQVINAALASRPRFDAMDAFFGAGAADGAGARGAKSRGGAGGLTMLIQDLDRAGGYWGAVSPSAPSTASR